MTVIDTIDGKMNVTLRPKNLSDEDYEHMVDMFGDIYEQMYNYGYDEPLVDVFDEMIKRDANFKKIVLTFNEHNHDFISSDREAAAFVDMLNEIGMLFINAA